MLNRILVFKGFTEQYNINKLVYVEQTNNIEDAIAREKQLKGWLRKKKVELIESTDPNWEDLSVNFDKLWKSEILRYAQNDNQRAPSPEPALSAAEVAQDDRQNG